MIPALIILGWLAIGAAVGLVEARRGHWHKGWVVSAIYGPLAIPLAAQARLTEPASTPVTIDAGEHRAAGLAVLVGVDGSDMARTAAHTIVDALAGRVARLTLAAVIDFDTAAATGGVTGEAEKWPERTRAEEALAAAATDLAPRLGLQPATVILAGEPSKALETYAADNDFDLLVAGTRGRGMTRLLFGSCAGRLGQNPDGVAVVLVPGPHEGRGHGSASADDAD